MGQPPSDNGLSFGIIKAGHSSGPDERGADGIFTQEAGRDQPR